MDTEKKTRFFDMLLRIGLKEIEVGFPSAGATEFDFISGLVQSGRIPDDVLIQVLTQARRDLIERSFESLRGAPRAIVHVYNAVSPAWRRVVFNMDRPQIKEIAVNARQDHPRRSGQAAEHGLAFRIQPRDLLDRRTRFQPGMLRGDDGHIAAHGGEAADPEPACHGRGGDAQYLCRPDRMVRPACPQSRHGVHLAPPA